MGAFPKKERQARTLARPWFSSQMDRQGSKKKPCYSTGRVGSEQWSQRVLQKKYSNMAGEEREGKAGHRVAPTEEGEHERNRLHSVDSSTSGFGRLGGTQTPARCK